MFGPAFLATTLLTLSASAIPAPSPAQLVPRACSTTTPSLLNVLQKSDPDTPSVDGVFRLQRDETGNTVDTVVTFDEIPDGATGCQLAVTIPPHVPGQFAMGDATQADVWLTAPDAEGTSTWNNKPENDQMVSTFIFPTTGSTDPFSTILWAGTCSETMSFFFELSTWQQGNGSVSFINSMDEADPRGFYMLYNC